MSEVIDKLRQSYNEQGVMNVLRKRFGRIDLHVDLTGDGHINEQGMYEVREFFIDSEPASPYRPEDFADYCFENDLPQKLQEELGLPDIIVRLSGGIIGISRIRR